MTADRHDDELETMAAHRGQNSPTAMLNEQTRLGTFLRWRKGEVRNMAKYGFYFTNEGDRVRCAFCGLEIEHWTKEMLQNVSLTHWKNAHTYCKFLKGEDVGNVPLRDSSTTSTGQGTSNLRHLSRSAPSHMEHIGQQSHPTVRQNDDLGGIFGRETSGPTVRRIDDVTLTFSRSLSEEGRGRMTENFQESAWFRTEHGHDMLIDTHPVVVVTTNCLGDIQTEVQRRISQTRKHASSSSVWADLVSTAQYPHMASFQARLDTFRRWPLIRPSGREMAKSGLFCVKSTTSPRLHNQAWAPEVVCADSVRCFWCGERLHNWRGSDDAVLEHARLSPRCRFVRQLLGDALHQDIVSSLNAENTRLLPIESPPTTTSPTEMRPTSEEDDIMNTPAVAAVLQMGFPPQLIRDILQHNPPRLDAETLCTLALQATECTAPFNAGPADEETRVFRIAGESQAQTRQGHGLTEQVQGHVSQGQGRTNEQQRRSVEDLLQEMGRKYAAEYYGSTLRAPPAGRREDASAGVSDVDKLICKVCMRKEVRVTFRPCGHLSCCSECSNTITVCPVCKRPFTEKIVTYLA